MNQSNLRRLISHLYTLSPDQFNMGRWFVTPADHELAIVTPEVNVCGTVGCIAGTVVIAFNREVKLPNYVTVAAQQWLDLTDEEALTLFYGHWSEKYFADITLPEVIEHLESLVQ